jgi:hypothetical protein
MSNRNNDNDFNFDDDDDLFGDRRTADDFDFGDDDSDFPSPLADDFGSDDDTPDFDEEQEERGPNRTFVFLAILMILMFVIGLGAVLFLATRPTGPTDAELTGTYVVQFNATQQAFLAQTQTQDAINVAATQTALLESVELTQQALLTQQADVAAASLLTQTAGAVELFNSLTQTALANPTNTRVPTNTPTPEEQVSVVTEVPELALIDAWATQVQFVTQQAQFDQEVFATQAAYATQIGASGQNPEAEAQINEIIQSTAAALGTQASSVQIAIIAVDNALATAAAENPDFATQYAQIEPIGIQTQTALAEFVLLPTASPTPVASGFDIDGKRNLLLRFPVNARSVFDPNGSQPEQIVPTPAAFSTAAALATQSALSTRQALIDRLLGTVTAPTVTPTNNLGAVNATATAIANAFISATQTAAAAGVIPTEPTTSFGTVVPTPETLPDTGLFDDIGGGDNIGLLALMVIGLVGVVFVSRRLRTSPATKDVIDGQQ